MLKIRKYQYIKEIYEQIIVACFMPSPYKSSLET